MENIVGIKSNNYPERRNFSGLNVAGYSFRKKLDLYAIPQYIYFKIRGKTHPRWLNLFWNFGLSNAKLYHFFNAVNVGNQPWVTTVEYHVPRGAHPPGQFEEENRYIGFALSRYAHPSCKKIIALSQFALNAQVNYLELFGKYKEEILSKYVVWHPSQPLHMESISQKQRKSEVHFVFVGADFFRKGGMEVLLAFDQMLAKGNNIRLTIVSKMAVGDYASQTTPADREQALALIRKHEAITLIDALSNQGVITLFREGDVGLLPSYDETYGYTVLEAQACGCPVITTNGGAFPEINNDNVGWMINVPLVAENGRSIPRSAPEKARFREIVVGELIRIVNEIMNDPAVLDRKGEASIRRIRDHHSIAAAEKRAKELYDAILGVR